MNAIDGGPTLAARIRGDLEQKILSGEWPPGHRIPFEHELTAQYACSRMTVNKVLSALAEAGLVTRRRRAGSFVAAPPAEQAVLQIQDFAEAAAQRGLAYRHTILRRAMEDGMLRVTCLHRVGETVAAHEDRVIALAQVPEAALQDFTETPPGSWLLRSVPWTQAEHVIRARIAGAAMARHLGISPAAACLVLERRTWLQGALVTEVSLTYPGERHALSGRFSPTGR